MNDAERAMYEVPGGRLYELRAAEKLVEQIRAICAEPLDEREGHGPTRHEQFARIDALVHGRSQ